MELLTLLGVLILCALGGYGIGRTIVTETIFESWRNSIKTKCFYEIDYENEEILTGVGGSPIFTMDDEGNRTILSEDGYRTDLPRPVSILLGKFGDLLECEICCTVQSAFQLYLWSQIITILSLNALGLFAVVGLAYLILNKLR